MGQTPQLFDDDGNSIELPFKWQICCSCDGHGKSSAYLGAFTSEDLHEQGPEFIEDYFGGHYDRACDECGGAGKIKVIDAARVPKKQLREYREQQRADREIDAIHRQERLMEGGWREEGWYGR